MRYRIRHSTVYSYAEPVAISHNVLHLAPRATAHQTVHAHTLRITPASPGRVEREDWFGNRVVVATVQEPHTTLTLLAESEVEVRAPDAPVGSPAWETVAAALGAEFPDPTLRPAVEFRFASALVPVGADYAALAGPSFAPGRALADAALDLAQAIQRDFRYKAGSTTVDTPVAEVLARRTGVCQDFAHLMLAALRSLGLAARYVSGYLETLPPPGRPRLQGADASHAWVAVFDPVCGWLDLDPTNGCRIGDRHVTVAWGRDVADVSPTMGMILGGGQSTVQVGVDVERVG